MAKQIEVKFKFERSTKGAHRFQEVNGKGEVLTTNNGATIGSLYLRKAQIGDDAPNGLTVTIAPSK